MGCKTTPKKIKMEKKEKYDGWLVSPSFGKRFLAFAGYNALVTLAVWGICVIIVMLFILAGGSLE